VKEKGAEKGQKGRENFGQPHESASQLKGVPRDTTFKGMYAVNDKGERKNTGETRTSDQTCHEYI